MSQHTRDTLISHILVGAIGALAAIRLPTVNAVTMFVAAMALSAIAAYIASRYSQSCLLNGLELIENAVVANEKPGGETEYHDTARHIVTQVSRLAAAAAKGREQSREVETVLAAFDRRVAGDRKSSPSRQLALLLKSLGREAQTTIDGISLIGADLHALRAQMIAVANEENELVRVAAGEVRQLATDVVAIGEYARLAKASEVLASGETESVSRQLLGLQQQLEVLREQIGICDKQSQSLRDQTVEIASLMQTIHEYSSRTDTMALNASIESVRAGEHGRAFATAADEIRKLTLIISDSTRDALDRLKLVECSVDDTTSICIQGHGTIDAQMTTARDLSRSVSEIRQSSNESREHLDKLLETSDTQLQKLNIVAGALGGVFESTEHAASQAEEELRARTELNDKLFELSGSLLPLSGSPCQNAQQVERLATSPAISTVSSSQAD